MRANYYSFVIETVEIVHCRYAPLSQLFHYLGIMNDGSEGNGFDAGICGFFGNFQRSSHAVAESHHL